MRNIETIEINGTVYTVEELSMRLAYPVLERLKDNQTDGQIALMAASLSVSGTKLTADDVNELGMTTYQKLIPIVMQVNGMAGKENPTD